MKKTELKRKTPLRNSSKISSSSTLKQKKPMARGTSTLARSTKIKPRKKGKPVREDKPLADLCRGQPCFLLLPGIPFHPQATVVPCHSNQLAHGKGKGIKAADEKTVPGCYHCHAELDQGKRFTKEEKFGLWDEAYERWVPMRDRLLLEAAGQGSLAF